MRLLAALALAAAPFAAAGGAPPPEGYRMEDYRAPTPDRLEGAEVIDTAAARELWESGRAVFLDVLPRPPRPEGLPPDTYWRPKPRLSVPGAVWLPNTGYGALSQTAQDYFVAGLAQATEGDPERPVVFFCLRDCWMSWNAAKRALEQGHARVLWWPDGTDGWAEAGLPLEPAEPLELEEGPRDGGRPSSRTPGLP